MEPTQIGERLDRSTRRVTMVTMAMPVVTEAHRRLDRLVGSWKGEERLYPSPFDTQGGSAIARVHNQRALDGFAVVQDYEQERDGKVRFRGHGIFRWDGEDGAYTLHWFDSLGLPPSEFRGQFEGEALTLVNDGPQGMTRAVFEFGGRSYTYRMQVSPDGTNWFPFMEGAYTLED
jgi:Protein of unknown function (DUF1579)